METKLTGQIVDLQAGEIYPGELFIKEGRIARIEKTQDPSPNYIIPGFVDAHIHIESTMLAPAEFARAVSVHGTVATVSDPHEIANVMGVEGVEYMLSESREAAVKINYGASPCVPATDFESSGARLGPKEVAALLDRPDVAFLSEVMNFPGVLAGVPDLLEKIEAARVRGKPVDGHAPQLRGAEAAAYAAAGISTDHECTSLEEARDKIAAGMKILIREGSAARNYEALEPLLFSHPERCMFCSDDLHPDAIVEGHINLLVRRAVAAGLPPLTALRVASLNPVNHYGLSVGLLQVGDPADFLVVEDLTDFKVRQTWVDGRLEAENGVSLRSYSAPRLINNFHSAKLSPDALKIPWAADEAKVEVILVEDGQLLTGRETVSVRPRQGEIVSDPENDLLKMVVRNRYQASAPPGLALIRNFGIRHGAIASSVAHDSHNLIAVGADDESICRAINLLVENQGGVCAVTGDTERLVPLPIAGLMSDGKAQEVAAHYGSVEELARELGSPLRAPLMTLSFMALLVIPELKLSDRGLFDAGRFDFIPLVS